MKKLIMVALTVFCIGIGNAQMGNYRQSSVIKIIKRWSWDGYDHVVFVSGGHWYLEVRSRTGSCVTVIHYETCPCKSHAH